MSNAVDDQINVSQVSDGAGGAIFAWDDHRNGADYDIYAHHIYFDGSSTVGLNELSKTNLIQSLCFPNPISESSSIQLKNNQSNSDWEIAIFDSYGRLKQKEELSSNGIFMLNSSQFEAGVYFYFINLKGESSSSNKGSFISVK